MTTPANLPPLPPVPPGFDRWIDRGTEWESECATYACPHCSSGLLWSEDRGPHCDGCDDYEGEPNGVEAREALDKIATIENRYDCGDWDEIEEAREIATEALARLDGNIPAHPPTVGCGEGSTRQP